MVTEIYDRPDFNRPYIYRRNLGGDFDGFVEVCTF
jgi:hypothetical protein